MARGESYRERCMRDPSFQKRHRLANRASYDRRSSDPEVRQRHREWYQKEGRARKLAQDHLARLRERGITQEQFNTLLERQGEMCALCGGHNTRDRALAINHDHRDGHVRGLLCERCNLALGWCYDDPDFLRRATAYVEA